MNHHGKINYIELPASNIEASKKFFTQVFNWTFEDYGPQYTAFSDQGIDGGFYQSDQHSSSESGAALVIFYSNNLEKTRDEIKEAGGIINKPIFSFPGGRRFHFIEPSGNELAVWSDVGL